MSKISAEETKEYTSKKLPRRHWQAQEPFGDLKASHWVEIALTVVLICVGILQFKVYARQANIMGQQLQSSYEEQRAFVFPTGITFDVENGSVDFQVIWKNSGTTPTKNLFSWTSWGGFEQPIDASFSFPDFAPGNKKPQVIYSLLGPQTTMMTSPATISSDTMNMVNSGKAFFYFWGWARYNDVFPSQKQHLTRFCYWLKSFNQTDGKFDETTTITYQPCDYGNCADDDCKPQWLG